MGGAYLYGLGLGAGILGALIAYRAKKDHEEDAE